MARPPGGTGPPDSGYQVLVEYTCAVHHAARALKLAEQAGFRILGAHALGQLADSHNAQGHRIQAADYGQRAAEQYRDLGVPAPPACRAQR